MSVVCAAKNCKYSSDNEDSTHVIFINFPNDDTSRIWAHHCGRTDLLMKSNEELHLNYYICSHHIEDRYYISKTDPIIIDQHAVPTLFESDMLAKKGSRDIFNREEQTEVTDNVVFSYCDMDTEIDQYRDINIRFPNLCRICGEPSLDGIEIFAAKGIELKLKDKISLHLPIAVNMEDLMPQKLCMNCYDKLEIAHSLVVTSLKTDMRLKRFLDINEDLNYDNKYNAIAKKCSLEIAKEMCANETNPSSSIELSSTKVEGIVTSQDITTKLSYLEDINTRKTIFANNVRKEMQSELNSLIESYHEENRGDSSINKTTTNNPNGGASDDNKIACLHCKDSFKTQEIFENHKILCDDEEITQKQKEIAGNINSSESNNVEKMSFQLVAKTCNVCNKHFEDEKHFAKHSHSKHSQEKHCQSPDKSDTTKEQDNTSKNSIMNTVAMVETNKQCGHCDLIYSIKKDLLNHITECHGGQPLFKCITCDKSYEKWSSLDVHEATHRIDKPYLCDLCGKSFKHSNNLRGHKRTHLDEAKKKRHVCDICGNAFRSRFHLGEHMNQHNGNKPYSCEKCGKAFYKRIQLRQHKLSHGVNKHTCPVCGAAFNRKGNMNTHLKRHDNGDGIYTCSVCAHRCKSMSELKLHRKKHTEEDIIESIRRKSTDKTIWRCEVCSRIFSTRAVLLNHERIHKGEKMNVECKICGKQLASKNSLIYHNKSVHSKERSHVCQYCGGALVSKEVRLIHERIHTGERPYACKVCKMEYKCSSNLNQHMKIHSGIKPHKCTYCNKSFTRKGALKVHERIHTGEKPFSCDTCGRTFSQKNDMLKHTKTHNAKTIRCEQCDEVFAKKKDILKHVALHGQGNPVAQEYAEVQQHIQPYSVNITCIEFE